MLRAFEQASGTFKKRANPDKIYIIPLFIRDQSAPTPADWTLGEERLTIVKDEIFLGRTMSRLVHRDGKQIKSVMEKALNKAKLNARLGIFADSASYTLITDVYQTLIEPVIIVNLTTTDQTAEDEAKITKFQAHFYRRWLRCGNRVKPDLLLIEGGWMHTTTKIRAAKARLMERIKAQPDREYHKHIWTVRAQQLRGSTERKGTTAAAKRFWTDGGRPEMWDAPSDGNMKAKKRLIKEVEANLDRDGKERLLRLLAPDRHAPYLHTRTYTGRPAMHMLKGDRRSAGLKTAARLGSLMIAAGWAARKGRRSKTCPECGQEDETLPHVLWRCPAWNDQRAQMDRDMKMTLSATMWSELCAMNDDERTNAMLALHESWEASTAEQAWSIDAMIRSMLTNVDDARTTNGRQKLTAGLYVRHAGDDDPTDEEANDQETANEDSDSANSMWSEIDTDEDEDEAYNDCLQNRGFCNHRRH